MRTRFLVRALATVAGLSVSMIGASAAQAASTPTPSVTASSAAASGTDTGGDAADNASPVVLIGTGGVSWDDVSSSTTGFYAFLDQGSSGWLAAKSVRATTCPVDGWLAVSSGRRAADQEAGPAAGQKSAACRTPGVTVATEGGTGRVSNWSDYVAATTDQDYDASPGLLGDTLAKAGKKAVAVGPGAAIALARSDGTVADTYPGVAPSDSQTDAQKLGTQVAAAVKQDPDVIVIDLGAERDPSQLTAGEPKPTGFYAQTRAKQVAALDTRLLLVMGSLPARSTVVLASLADSGDTAAFQLVGAGGPVVTSPKRQYSASLLSSGSTRQAGLAQTTDLMPTLLQGAGVTTPDDAVGAPLTTVMRGKGTADRLQHLDDLQQSSRKVHSISPWFLGSLVGAQIVLYGLIVLTVRRRSKVSDSPTAVAVAHRRRRPLTWLRVLPVFFACVPAATFLANLFPWWRAGGSAAWQVLTAIIVAIDIPLALLALLGPWRRSFLGTIGVVGAETALVLAGDVLTGSHLVLSSVMGLQPLLAGRFYGFSNPTFALFTTGALLSAMALASWFKERGQDRAAWISVAVIGVLAVIIDGTPGIGSDFGGPPAIIPAFAVLGLLIAGVRVDLRKGLIIAGSTIGVIVVLSVADWLRPAADRTHLGRFVQTALDGGAWGVIQRKLAQNIGILFMNWMGMLLPFAVVLVVLFVAWPARFGAGPLQLAYDRSAVLRQGIIAFGIVLFIGFALNDSGVTVPPAAATVMIPLLFVVSAWALQRQDADDLSAAIARTRKGRKVSR